MCTAATVTEEVTQCTLPPKRVCRITAERKEFTIKVRWRGRGEGGREGKGRERGRGGGEREGGGGDCLQWVRVGWEVYGHVVTLCSLGKCSSN